MATAEEIKNLLSTFKTEIVDSVKEEIRNGMGELRIKEQELEEENSYLREELKLVKKELMIISSKEKERNIRMYNLEDTEIVNKNLMENILKLFAEVDIKLPEKAVSEVKRIGKMQGKRPVLLVLASSVHRSCIFDKFQELKEKKI